MNNMYKVERIIDKQKVNKLIKKGFKVVFSKNDNYVVINGEVFNGFGKKDFRKWIKREVEKLLFFYSFIEK